MNTGEKNSKGRTVYRGPKGGKYVIDAKGKKLYKFVVGAPNVAGYTKTNFTSTYNGTKYNVYKKNGTELYYLVKNGVPALTVTGLNILTNKNGKKIKFLDYLKKLEKPPTVTHNNVPGFTATPYEHRTLSSLKVYKKNASGRYYFMEKLVDGGNGKWRALRRANMLKNTRTGEIKMLDDIRKNEKKKTPAPKAPAPKAPKVVLPKPPKMLTPSPKPTTAERAKRLSAIRHRLSAIRREKLARAPKTRKNVEQRLKNVLARVRRRMKPTFKSSDIQRRVKIVSFCHAPASVPRKKCKDRTEYVYYADNPEVKSGEVVGTRYDDIDDDWIRRQNKYISSLNDYDFWTVQAHTNRSHFWIGPFLYKGTAYPTLPGISSGTKTHIAPLWPQVNKLIEDGIFTAKTPWVQSYINTKTDKAKYQLYVRYMNTLPRSIMLKALTMYRDDLKRIIAKAPKSRQKMVFYRGQSSDVLSGTKGHWHTLNSFCSSAYTFDWAFGYSRSRNRIQRITVLPGTPVLFVAGVNQWDHSGEYEVMINLGTKYLIRERNVKRQVVDARAGSVYSDVFVTDVTIAKT
jgi:rubredoxin